MGYRPFGATPVPPATGDRQLHHRLHHPASVTALRQPHRPQIIPIVNPGVSQGHPYFVTDNRKVPLSFPRESRSVVDAPANAYTGIAPHNVKASTATYVGGTTGHTKPTTTVPNATAQLLPADEPSQMHTFREKANEIRKHAQARQFKRYKRDMGRAWSHAVSSSYYAVIMFVITGSILLLLRPSFVYASVDDLTSPQLSPLRIVGASVLSAFIVFGVHFWKGRPSVS